MDTMQLSKNDIKLLLIGSALLPILCFVLGLYTANSLDSSSINREQMVDIPATLKDNNSIDPELKLSAPAQIANMAVDIDTPANPSQSENQALTDTNIASTSTAHYNVQAGSFSKQVNATKFQSKLQNMGIASQITDNLKNNEHTYRVILDSFISKEEAIRFLTATKEKYELDLYVTFVSVSDYSKNLAVL